MKMVKKDENGTCCLSMDGGAGYCKVESVINVDDRGQMVLPKELRDRAKIHAGDKLAVISWEKGGKLCCIALMKAEDFTEMVKSQLGPLVRDVVGE